MDFEQLVLSTEDLNALRVIAQAPVDQTAEWAKRVKTLCEKKLVKPAVDPAKMQIPGHVYQITTDGELYLRYIDRRKSEMHFANTMSVLAFIVSFIALVVSIVR